MPVQKDIKSMQQNNFLRTLQELPSKGFSWFVKSVRAFAAAILIWVLSWSSLAVPPLGETFKMTRSRKVAEQITGSL